jgi:hypothetical protein
LKNKQQQFESDSSAPFFQGYQDLNDQVNQSCSDLMKNFPFLWIIFEKTVRNSINKTDPSYMIPSGHKILIAYLYQKLFFLLAYLLGSRKGNKVILALPRFEHLSNTIQTRLVKDDYAVIKSISPSLNNIWTLFKSNFIYLGLLGLIVLDYKSIINLLRKKQNHFDENELKILAKADSAIRKHIIKLTKNFNDNNIKVILATGSTSFATSTFCTVCKNLDIKFIVIAHGFIGNRYLMTVAPIHSTYFIVWSKSQLEEISHCLDERERNKLIYLGYPGKRILPSKRVKKNKILFAITTLSKIKERKRTLEALNYLIRKLKSNYECVIRLHPKDFNKHKEVSEALNIQLNFISLKTLSEDLSESFVVISTGSSVLFEAYANNIQAYNLKEWHEETSGISINEVPTLYSYEILKYIDKNIHKSNTSVGTNFLENKMDKFTQLLFDKNFIK